MYDSSGPSSTSTAVALTAARPRREHGVLDTVKVSPDTFRSVLFMGSAERKEWSQDNRPNRDKPQKRDKQTGLPEWSVQVAVVNWRGQPSLLTVRVPMPDDPAGKFQLGQPVELVELVMGVSPRRTNGYAIWYSADDITPLSVRTTAV
jgi:hypothetical protein